MTKFRIFLCLLGLAQCVFSQEQTRAASVGSASDSNSGDYVLQPLDLIQIKIFQEPTMDREVRISREKTVTLPLIGRISVASKSISEVEALLRDLYDRDYLVNPQINVIVLEYSRRTVKVLGMVANPGEIDFPREEGLTLIDAISRAGGFTRLAEKRKVKLTRKLDSGKIETFTIERFL